MKKILLILLIGTLPFSCKKEKVNIDDIKGTMDLKDLSLPELKNFLNGRWRFQYAIRFTIAGVDTIQGYNSKSYFVFYSNDSLMRTSEISNVTIREKVMYERLKISGFEDKAYVLKFNPDVYGFLNNWVADRIVNDTLVFVSYFQSEGDDNFFFTKE